MRELNKTAKIVCYHAIGYYFYQNISTKSKSCRTSTYVHNFRNQGNELEAILYIY
jgi:hypothetical protein